LHGFWLEKANYFVMAKKELEFTLKISPNYTHTEAFKKALAQTPQGN
jgi:hypothetical protein